MDKVWLYVGGILAGMAVVIYIVFTFVMTTHPPATDPRGAYETAKSAR